MRLPRNIRENLRFLLAESGSQLASLRTYFREPANSLAKRILDRGGYAYNLKLRIHESCLDRISRLRKADDSDVAALRALESIATDLERLTELCRDCIRQLEQMQDLHCLRAEAYRSMLGWMSRAIGQTEPAIRNSDTPLALKIGRVKPRIDRACRKLRKKYTADLKHNRNATEDLIAALLVSHCIEQMGDTLLNISEAVISINLGYSVNSDRYHSLQTSMEHLGVEDAGSGLVIEPIAETRSGSAISGITTQDSEDDGYVAIFKDGQKRKLKEERQGLKNWHEIYPGLAPRILSYHKRRQSAALLIEHLAGLTFEQILLHESRALLRETLDRLSQTLESVWNETRTKKPVCANHMRQLARRLDDVYSIHPEFREGDIRICGRQVPAFNSLVKQALAREAQLCAPYSVYIHGDFNVDNIIYDPVEKRINFIDLHRSRYMDYVQDVSVFMVSNYRLQVLDVPLRRRILQLTRDFYRFAADFAEKSGDRTFEIRLALGLARSFVTSTRFILDKSLARAMFMRSRYLLEQVLETEPGQEKSYRVPVREIFIG
ncbi:MAG: PhoU domain-containing protein [Gammaproteobacteria bacterium]|jgi:phosphate uptake regulator/aminoglycoside phosphotransferase (APT) family kinase protein